MAKVLAVMGDSGSGKTTAMRTLDPTTTYYIDSDKKGLSWKGWKTQYRKGQNYLATDNPTSIYLALYSLNCDEKMREIALRQMQRPYAPLPEDLRAKYTGIKTIVIDTLNGVMVGEEIRRMKEKNYDKWIDIASFVYGIIDYALTMRDDLTVIMVFHSETIRDDLGNVFTRIKTNGRKLEKIVLESKFSTVLLATGPGSDYVFKTRAPDSTAKAPMGAFEGDTVANDMKEILQKLDEF